MSTIRFDDALNHAKELVTNWLADKRLRKTDSNQTGVIVRDALGRCALLLAAEELAEADTIPAMREELRQAFGPHAFPGDAVLILPKEHPAPDSILSDPLARPAFRDLGVKLLDRLQTNQDWLRPPLRIVPRLPLGVAFSIKGGVGRSTAFAMLALKMARDGKRVVVIDLDLEAPGIGPLLLGEAFPAYGLVDWLAESLVETTDANLLSDMLMRAPAAIENNWPGDLRVIPAWGDNTKDYIAKLGRAYMPTYGKNGRPCRFADRLDGLIQFLAKQTNPPEVVLLDARAGLHDIGAAAITQLGAQVFMFARDEPPNWQAYKKLFKHLQDSPQIATLDENQDLRLRLKLCAAMMENLGDALEKWRENAYDACLEMYDKEDNAPYSFDLNAEEAPHYALPVVFSAQIRGRKSFGAEIETEWPVLFPAFEYFARGAESLIFAYREDDGV